MKLNTKSFRLPFVNYLEHIAKCKGWGGTPYNGLYGEAPPERDTLFRLQLYERVGILLIEVYERVGKSVIWVCERVQRANR